MRLSNPVPVQSQVKVSGVFIHGRVSSLRSSLLRLSRDFGEQGHFFSGTREIKGLK